LKFENYKMSETLAVYQGGLIWIKADNQNISVTFKDCIISNITAGLFTTSDSYADMLL